MKTGCLFDFRNPPQWAQPYADLYNDTIDDMVAVEELGFDTAWTTEHHFLEDGYLPSQLAVLSAVAARTQRIGLGTFVLLLPLHDPVRVAEDAAVVDLISRGRLILGLGQGYRVGEFTGFEKDHKRRGSALSEGIDILRKSWSGETFSHAGKFWSYTDIMVTPAPAQPGGPPLMAGARSEKGIQRVARMGCHFLPIGNTEDIDIYRTACTDLGREPGQVRILRSCYVTEKDDSELDKVWPHVNYQVDYYAKWMHEANDKPEDRTNTSDGFRDLSNFFTGPPQKVLDEIKAFEAESGIDELVLFFHFPGMDRAVSRGSMQRFAADVLPHLS